MRRPPGLWILLSAGVLWLNLQDVYGIRATSLIFGKSTTTTTTTEDSQAAEEEAVTTEAAIDANSTKPPLTGNPQLDYVWDPNLPKELNGFNLSDYPFYERVPEDIDFKCDGLHDGFYASVPHKCQVYHHCLFGTRYDFLCANFTAFDQTLFNCNFASNVDCRNSKKFWHRNDELYKTVSTTTTAAPIVYNFYTRAPPANLLTPLPGQVLPVDQVPPVGAVQPQLPAFPPVNYQPRPGMRPRPYPRRRPQYDYYDEEDYEELPRVKGRRKRPRPRPVYYDEYEEEEDRMIRRGGGNRRRPYSRRPNRRDKDRRKFDYDDEDDRMEDEELALQRKQKEEKRRKLLDDYEEEEDTSDRYEGRQGTRYSKPRRKYGKRPAEDDYEYEEDRRKPIEESKESDKRRPHEDRSEDSRKPPRLGKRRPPSQDYEDDLQQADEPSANERPKKSNKETRAIIKPVSGTIYDRPRLAPRINLPVPKNAADKYAYKPIGTQSTSTVRAEEVEEEYDDYEEPLPRKKQRKYSTSTTFRTSERKLKEDDYSDSPSRYSKKPKIETDRGRDTPRRANKRPIDDEYEDTVEQEEEPTKPLRSFARNNVAKSTTTATPTTTTEPSVDQPMPVIRKFKRPFLPSRGGNPYAGRNLQPVGVKAQRKRPEESAEISLEDSQKNLGSASDENDKVEIQVENDNLTPDPVRIKSRNNSREVTSTEKQDDPNGKVKTEPLRLKIPLRYKAQAAVQDGSSPQGQNRQNHEEVERPSAPPKLADPDDENYDVSLNEAISPILPNLPRSYPNDYAYNRFQRPTKYVILDPVVSPGNTYYVK